MSMMSMNMKNEPQTTARMPMNGMMVPPSDPMMEEENEEMEEDMELPPQFNAPGTEKFFISHPLLPSLPILFLIFSSFSFPWRHYLHRAWISET